MERIQPQLAASTFLVLPSSCPTGSSRTAHPGAPHFHITVRLIRATSTGGGRESSGTPVMKFGRCLTRVSPYKSETSLCRRSCIPVHRRASRFRAPLLEIVRELAGRGKLLLFPLSTPLLLGLSGTRDFFQTPPTRNTFNYF